MKNTDKKYETYEYMCNLDRVERFKKGLANDIKDAYTARDFKEVLNKTFYLCAMASDMEAESVDVASLGRAMLCQELAGATSSKDLIEVAKRITEVAKNDSEQKNEKTPDKNTPLKPLFIYGRNGDVFGYCQACYPSNHVLLRPGQLFCWLCGQRQDWDGHEGPK